MEITNLIIKLPWHRDRRWQNREQSKINKIIIHQELADGSIESVNQYHINPGAENHISEKGCPHFCYHYGIRKFKNGGEIAQVNELSHITWHTGGQNASGVGIMLEGCFRGTGFQNGEEGPTPAQISSLQFLVGYLLDALDLTNQDVYGHYHFGKPACPGYKVSDWIEKYRFGLAGSSGGQLKPMETITIQKTLNEAGYNCGKPDGIIGPRTIKAIRNYQHDNNLVVDGIPGPQTQRALQNI